MGKAALLALHRFKCAATDARVAGMDDPCFAVPAPDTLISVELDGLVALYDRASAMTHVLAEPAPEIVSALAAAPLKAAQLLTALDLPDDADTRPAVLARLAELEASGLVRRI